jgi:hypothetical protein
MCSIDGDAPDVYRATDHVARVQHKCIECNRVIEPGETYRRAFMVYEGHPDTYKTCTHCQVGQAWLAENCGGFLHHGLIEEMEEHAATYPDHRFGFLRIKVGMSRKWHRFDGAGLMRLPPLPVAVGEWA